MSGIVGHHGLLFSPAGPPPTDPLFAFVTSLLHLDGTDGGTSFPDIIGTNTWAQNGSPLTSTTQKKFGTASLFPNNGTIVSATPMGAGVGTGDFCIEGWFYANPSGGTFRGLFDTLLNSTVNGIAVGFNTSTNVWQVYFGGGAHDNAGTMPTSAWTHFALERVGTQIDLYIGGVSQNSFTDASSNTDPGLNYGAYFSTAAAWSGWIDECRVTVGASRYAGTFTPPTSPFPDS